MYQQKTILQGSLHFGSEKSFVRARRMYEGRLESYYKNELAFVELENFNEVLYTFDVPRTVTNLTEKHWLNTVDAMNILSQFALCGKIEAYQTDSGKILQKEVIVPNNEKGAVRDYWKAKLLFEQDNYSDALQAIRFCLSSYDKHVQALELAGLIFAKEGDQAKSIEYFTKALQAEPKTYTSYLNRGLEFFKVEEFEKAVADFDNAIKHSLAVLDIHWRARLEKARGLVELGSHETARKELKFFISKRFKENSDNALRKREAYYLMGQSYLSTDEHKNAIGCFDQALEIEGAHEILEDAKCIFYRGLAKKEEGVNSFSEDFSKASEMGFNPKKVAI